LDDGGKLIRKLGHAWYDGKSEEELIAGAKNLDAAVEDAPDSWT